MTTNINMSRKPNLGEYSGFPISSPAEYMANMAKQSSNFPLSNTAHNAEASMMGQSAQNPFPTNHYGQGSSPFNLSSRQFENPIDIARHNNPLVNSNMSPYTGLGSEQFAMRFPMKYRNPELLNVNKSIEQVNYTQRPGNTSPWPPDFLARGQRIGKNQGDLAVKQTMNIDQPPFTNHGSQPPFTNHGSQPAFPMQSRFMPSDMYKPNDQQFAPRGFHPQDFYQHEQMRQMTNQYPPHPGSKFMGGTSGTAPFPQSVIPKGSQESPLFPQFSTSPKANGPHPMLNIHNSNMSGVPFHNPNFPVSPVGSQGKPNFPLGMRGTVSPNVTIGSIGLPKKQYQQPDEGVISPSGNQNAAAAAAAAAVLAAINTANSHTSPQGDMHNVPSRPPSIHTRDGNSRSPATSLSDHKSESGGSGINDLIPSPALSHTSPQVTQFAKEVAGTVTGRVPSPSVNQLPSSDIEAMIHSVSNISSMSTNEPPSSQRNKREHKPLPKLNTGSNLSPVTPPSPFSLSPSITDFELDILSPSWEDGTAGTTTLFSKLYKLSDEPERKIFLDRLVLLAEQQGKTLRDVPNFNGVVLDLYTFYKLINDRGGFHEVIRLKLWKEVIQDLTNSREPNPVDSQTLRDHYMKLVLPFESKINLPTTFNSPATNRMAATTASPSQLGSIDLSSMNYKNLSMYQSNTSSFNQGAQKAFSPSNQTNSPIPHQYRNAPPPMSGYHPSGSQRIPNYPGSPSPGYPTQQIPGYPSSQMANYHNSLGYRGTPPEAMFHREQHAEFSRGSPQAMTKPYMADNQHQSMFPNFPQPPQHGMMYPQQHSNNFPMSKKPRFGTRSGTASPEQRALQNQWGHKYPQASTDPANFHPSQSPKIPRVRPPPPYPHPKLVESMTSQHMRPRKDEVMFPSGCVESTKPTFTRKRRLTARDIGPVEAWRIMMSLKSGLLSETAWALDTLTILLCDDSTVGFFRLAHLPGLLDIVVEHYRRNLIHVFGILDDSEVETGVPKRYTYGYSSEEGNKYTDKIPHLIAEENFSALIVADLLDDNEEPSFTSGSKTWSHGGGDTTIHIQTHFETDPEFYRDKGNNCDVVKLEKRVDILPQVEVKSERSVNLSCKEAFVYNGITSPKRKQSKVVRRNETKFDVKPTIFCNGEDNACSPVKTEDPSVTLIQRLKTELDLDVDSLNEDEYESKDVGRVNASLDEECELRQEFPLSTLTWSQDSAIKCCICVSNIIRSLSFVPQNDVEMARHPSLLLILGKLFLLHHLQKRKGQQHSDKQCWWKECLDVVRENALVTVANIAGYLDLSLQPDTVSNPVLDGLLHWLVCQSTTAIDSFGNMSSLSPKHLSLETLAKMSVLESNVNFILTSPDKETLSKVYEYLVKLFSDKSNEVTREFSLVLLSSLTQSHDTISTSCSDINLITVLVGFLEDATEKVETMAARGLHAGIFHDDDMHVSGGMLRRAAGLLACIAKRTNSGHLIPFQERLLSLSMSHLLDVEVQSHLCNVLYNLPR